MSSCSLSGSHFHPLTSHSFLTLVFHPPEYDSPLFLLSLLLSDSSFLFFASLHLLLTLFQIL